MTTKEMISELEKAIDKLKSAHADPRGVEAVVKEIIKREYAASDKSGVLKLRSQALEAARSCGSADYINLLAAADKIHDWLTKKDSDEN